MMTATASTPAEIRNENYGHQQPGHKVMQIAVWQALQVHGPCTTRQLAERCGISILSVRPRVCELVELRMVDMVGREKREGVYRALSGLELEERIASETVELAPQKELGL
jgi:transcription initiation factor IIE alpha subunit